MIEQQIYISRRVLPLVMWWAFSAWIRGRDLRIRGIEELDDE